MYKIAYELGMKLALADAGLLSPENDETLAKLAAHPAESLAAIFQNAPNVPVVAGTEKVEDEPPKYPKEDDRTYSGHRSGSITGDMLGSIGLDVRGPIDTSV